MLTTEGLQVCRVYDLPTPSDNGWKAMSAYAARVQAVRDGYQWAVVEAGEAIAFAYTKRQAEAICRTLAGVSRQAWAD